MCFINGGVYTTWRRETGRNREAWKREYDDRTLPTLISPPKQQQETLLLICVGVKSMKRAHFLHWFHPKTTATLPPYVTQQNTTARESVLLLFKTESERSDWLKDCWDRFVFSYRGVGNCPGDSLPLKYPYSRPVHTTSPIYIRSAPPPQVQTTMWNK